MQKNKLSSEDIEEFDDAVLVADVESGKQDAVDLEAVIPEIEGEEGEEESAKKQAVSSKVVFKSGLWYTISTFLFSSIAFITTPIIVRVLTKSEYGAFNNMASWIGFVVIFVSLCLDQTIIRAKLDYEEEIDSYALSVLIAQSIFTCIVFGIFWIFHTAISDYTGIDSKYFLVMFLYTFFLNAYSVFVVRERAHYRYKVYSLVTGFIVVGYCLFTLYLVLTMENKLDAIVYGNFVPYIVVGLIFYILIIKDAKCVKLEHVRYAVKLGLPLLPHTLSIILLESSDTIMITNILGAEFTALYSLSSKVPNMVSVLSRSMNGAWAPWFLDTLKAGDKKTLTRVSSIYFIIFLSLVFGVMLIAPEIVYIFGGQKYLEGLVLVPALIVGVIFQSAYTMYVQVEFYEKKMSTVSTATLFAAIANVVLNFVFMKTFGYQVAAYTSLSSYVLLFSLHYRRAYKLGYKTIFNPKIMFGGLFLALALIYPMLILYKFRIIRYIVTVVYGSIVLLYLFKNRKLIKSFMSK